MKPWHYIVEDGKLSFVSEGEAEQRIKRSNASAMGLLRDSSENLPLKHSQVLLNVRREKEDVARQILEPRLQVLVDIVEAGEVPGLSGIFVIRVDFCAAVRIHYWFTRGLRRSVEQCQ